MILSLDTNVLIDLTNGRQLDVRKRYNEARTKGHILMTSSLAAHELLYGAVISRRRQVQLRSAQEMLGDLEIADWAEADTLAAARLRAELRRLGQGIGYVDMLIAGQAIARNWTVVSANLRHFTRVNGLSVVDWTSDFADRPEEESK